MKTLVNIILFISLISCVQEDKYKDLSDFFLYENVEVMLPKSSYGEVTHPLNAWVNIFSSQGKCFYYKTPYKEKLGVIRMTKRNKKCSYSGKKLSEHKGIKSFHFDVISTNNSDLKAILRIDKAKLILKMLNTAQKPSYQILSSGLRKSYLDDIFINQKQKEVRTLNSGDLCHGVNSNCQNVVGYRCEKCPGAYYEVVDFNCPQGGSKYCGQENCGKKNQPACPRGYDTLQTKLKSLCFDGSPAGFCGPGLQTLCNENNILICI